MDAELVLRARIKELTPRKAVVETILTANAEECVRAEVIAVRLKQS
jgi:hypothetical protein